MELKAKLSMEFQSIGNFVFFIFLGGEILLEVRNKNNKKVCEVDKVAKQVIIALKGSITMIQFTEDGKVKIINK